MRIFVALDVDEAIRQRIAVFLGGDGNAGVRGFAPEARWVQPESLHVTLKFVGEQAPDEVKKIQSALRAVFGPPFDLGFRGYGFFPNPKAARVFWIGIEAGPQLTALAAAIDAELGKLGIPAEEHAFSPHLTLARGGRGSGKPQHAKGDLPNSQFQRLIEKLDALPAPDFGTMTAHEFCLYQSQLGSGGSRYTKIGGFTLG